MVFGVICCDVLFYCCFDCLHFIAFRYKILNAKGVKEGMTPQEATKVVLGALALDPEQYRFGHTKVQNPSLNQD